MTKGSTLWPWINTAIRAILCAPLAPVIMALVLTGFGAPIGLYLGALIGAFVTAPIRRHPLFNVKGDAE